MFVSEKKTSMLADGDPTELLAKAKIQISRMEKFLRLLDKDQAKEIVPLSINSYYWSGAEDLRQQFYGV